MKKILILAILLIIPALLYVNVRQTVRYEQLERSVRDLEADQKRLLEENKRAIAAIEILTSPRRIEELARRDLGLERISPENVTYVSIATERSGE